MSGVTKQNMCSFITVSDGRARELYIAFMLRLCTPLYQDSSLLRASRVCCISFCYCTFCCVLIFVIQAFEYLRFMRYKLLILLWVLGSTTDLAPDIRNPLYSCINHDVDVMLDMIVGRLIYYTKWTIDFITINIILPTTDFTTTIIFNITSYVNNHSFIWLLLFKLETAYHHTGYGVRSFKCYRSVFFGRTLHGIMIAAILLLGAAAISANTPPCVYG